MTSPAVWQQILAVDARYNTYRASCDPQFRTLYMRRRSQLLRDQAKTSGSNINEDGSGDKVEARKSYLKTRHFMLAQRYGNVCLADGSSIRSRPASTHSSRHNLDARARAATLPSPTSSPQPPTTTLPSFLPHTSLTPTSQAEASRALVGYSTVSESYAFAGVHHIFDQHQATVRRVEFAINDQSRLACCSLDGSLSICQVIPEPATVICLLRGHVKGVADFQWCQSNDLLVSASYDCTVRVWSVASGQCLRCVEDPVNAEVLAVTFHPLNNNMLITGNSRGFVQALNISTGKYYKAGSSRVSGQIMSLAFDDYGQLLWAGDNMGLLHSYKFDCATGKISKCRKISISEGCPVTCISARTWITREAKDPSLLVNCANNSLYLFRILDPEGNLQLKRRLPVKHRSCSIRSSFCPIMSFRHGACVVSGSEDCTVLVFDVTRDTRPCINKLQGHSAPVLDVCFNYDESLLATCDSQGLVIIWKRELKQQ